MGHLGLTPQSVNALGGFRVQGKDLEGVRRLLADARALEAAGCFAIVVAAVPDVVGQMVTDTVGIPTIGIGAGPHCDGQVLVFHDLLGMDDNRPAKFVRRYAYLHHDALQAVRAWALDVRSGSFPSESESYHLTSSMDIREALEGRPISMSHP
jgi:3-methyl-2-oxobutanoate hydroxymethyltransferase